MIGAGMYHILAVCHLAQLTRLDRESNHDGDSDIHYTDAVHVLTISFKGL